MWDTNHKRHPVKKGFIKKALLERTVESFLTCVTISDSGCWTWKFSINPGGYAQASLKRPTPTLVHRYSYETFVGEIGAGLTIDHLCRNRSCINPAHLEAVTSAENKSRGASPAALNKMKTHCLRGHLLSPDNLMKLKNPKPRRYCLTCARIATRKRRGTHHE